MAELENVQPSVKLMFPGRFLDAEEDFKDKVLFYTIKRPGNDSELAKALGKPFANVLTFVEVEKHLLLNVTNSTLIETMFPGDPNKAWPGKRLGLRRAKTRFFGTEKPCIRVCGSPDIEADKKATVRMGLKTESVTLRAFKPVSPANGEQAVKSVSRPENNSQPEINQQQGRRPVPEPDPPTLEAWSILGWSREQGMKDHGDFQGTDYLAHLSTLIDEENAKP